MFIARTCAAPRLDVDQVAGPPYEPMILGAAVLLVEWAMLWWMYRRRIFLKV